jgi:chromosome segregation ATPase
LESEKKSLEAAEKKVVSLGLEFDNKNYLIEQYKEEIYGLKKSLENFVDQVEGGRKYYETELTSLQGQLISAQGKLESAKEGNGQILADVNLERSAMQQEIENLQGLFAAEKCELVMAAQQQAQNSRLEWDQLVAAKGAEIETQKSEITKLKLTLELEKNNYLNSLNSVSLDLEKKFENIRRDLEAKSEQKNESLSSEFKTQTVYLESLKTEISQKTLKIDELQSCIKESNGQILSLSKKVEISKSDFEKLLQKNAALKEKNLCQESQIHSQKSSGRTHSESLAEKSKEIGLLQEFIDTKD